LCEDLDRLVSEHGVDGFKFDAGDLRDFRSGDRNAAMAEPTEQCEAWARIAARYRFNELRACWKMGGQPLAQRLHDKPPLWGASGLASLIPESIAQGLIGHPFVCPDMVGGGDVNYCSADRPVDQELFVRYAQCAALFPMMQFSMAPARVLDAKHLHAVQAAVQLRQQLATEILDLVHEAAASGEPILRPLAYHFSGYEHVHDQFLLGERILVAPVLNQGASTRSVELPPGSWIGVDGHSLTGPTQVELPVDLESIPWFRRDEQGLRDTP
jgi:alpha-glucosidase (family GH31 glycosyl hydrolase)